MVEHRWSEEASLVYQAVARVAVPRRAEQMATMLALIPELSAPGTVAVELGCGEGFLSAALLESNRSIRVIALDGSEEMRAAAAARLERFGERVEVRDFDLGNPDWLPALDGAGVVLSSLVIHHLDDNQKQSLFGQVRERISSSGALLIADIIHPARPEVNSMFALSYEDAVKSRSIELTGDLRLWERFDQEHWNHYRTPDFDFDKPSVLAQQLQWLIDAGFEVADCFWMFAGHAVYGAYASGEGSSNLIDYQRALEVVHGILGE